MVTTTMQALDMPISLGKVGIDEASSPIRGLPVGEVVRSKSMNSKVFLLKVMDLKDNFIYFESLKSMPDVRWPMPLRTGTVGVDLSL